MLTPDEETAVRALLAERPSAEEVRGLRALLDEDRLTVAETRRARDLVNVDRQLHLLAQEARTIGSPTLLRRLFVLVAEGTATVASLDDATVALEDVPINANADLAHTHYLVSAYNSDQDADVTGQGAVVEMSGIVAALAQGIHTMILKNRATSGDDRITVQLRIVNYTGAEVDVAYQVWRIVRLGARA